MNSTFLRVLAILMGVAAIATASLGYRMSQKKPEAPIKVTVPTYTHVIAQHDIPAGHILTIEDLEVATTSQLDKQSFSDPQGLIGKATAVAVVKGAPFSSTDFPADNVLSQALASDERAIAIKVSEVIGVGGFINPGNHVDVLLYLRTDRETGEVSSAQVVLSNVKVLAYGPVTLETATHKNDLSTTAGTDTLAGDHGQAGPHSKSLMDNNKESRSAILAVPARDVSKLMLADSTGILRLALRSNTAAEPAPASAENQFIRLREIAHADGSTAPTATKVTGAPAQQVPAVKRPSTPASKPERVIVHRGEKVEIVKVAK